MQWSRHRHAPWYLGGMSFAESSFFPSLLLKEGNTPPGLLCRCSLRGLVPVPVDGQPARDLLEDQTQARQYPPHRECRTWALQYLLADRTTKTFLTVNIVRRNPSQ